MSTILYTVFVLICLIVLNLAVSELSVFLSAGFVAGRRAPANV